MCHKVEFHRCDVQRMDLSSVTLPVLDLSSVTLPVLNPTEQLGVGTAQYEVEDT